MTTPLTKILHSPQRFVDAVGMYRIVTITLLVLLGASVLGAVFGEIAYSVSDQLVAVVPTIVIALGLNVLFSKLKNVSANHESALITALIVFFLAAPQPTLIDNWAMYAAVAAAIFSKFFIVYRKQHIVNPAAAGLLLVAFGIWITNIVQGTQYTTDLFSWWVSNPILFLPTLIFGGLVVLKIRKWTPVLAFILAGLVMFLYESWKLDLPLGSEFIIYFLSWPTLFLAFFMLTEPFTMPPTKRTQIFYGALVALVANTTLFAPFIAMTPELALVIGNLAIYPYRIRQKLFLTFIEKREIAKNTFEFIFKKPAGFTYQAGQYLEWMLPHEKSDSRGVRRYFTIASSPTESVVRLALKFVPAGSSYKQKLQSLAPGDIIIASQLAGDFMLPKDTHCKLAFIAGGIGVTPFSSHITYIKDTKADYDVQLFYCVNQLADLAYYDEFLQATKTIKLETIPLVAKAESEHTFETGYLTKEIIERRTPDYKERLWYISGPPPMVSAYKSLLLKSGVARNHIVTDYFPGLA